MPNIIDPKSIGKPGRNRFKVGVVSKWSDGRTVVRTPQGWQFTNKQATFKGSGGGSTKKGPGSGKGYKTRIAEDGTILTVKTKKVLRVVRKI